MYQLHILLVWSLLVWKIIIPHETAATNLTLGTNDEDILSRSKRFVYYSSDNRLTVPPGTTGIVHLSLSLPVYRNAPIGIGSEMDISIPIIISFDDLGYSSDENPWGLWPDFGIFRKKRQAWEPMDGVNWAGGDREMVFQIVEDYISYLGMEGKACLLRAICEVFETPVLKHGLFGEILQLIFTVSNSIGATERLPDYLEAEELGRKLKSCSKYYAGCSKSLFTHNAQMMKNSTNIERTHHNIHKMSKEDCERRRKAMLEKRTLGTNDEDILSRSKRLVYYTSDNRLTVPPGTTGIVVLSLLLPVYRNAPIGIGSEMDISIPIIISFDDLGYSSDENPWGLWPDFGIFRKKRQAWDPMDGVNWAGGDREMVFQAAEDYLSYLGMGGKPCLLRAICEVFETPVLKHGLFGEILQLIFSVSNSIGAAERLSDYLEAEELGRKLKSCSKYYAGCSKSLFTHNSQKMMKDPTNIERTHRNNHKMSKEDSERRRKAMLEKANELLERGKHLNKL